jgi:hypothetical protein
MWPADRPRRRSRQARNVQRSAAVPLSPFLSPRLHTNAAPAHHHRVRPPAAALGAAEFQILQRAIALAGVDDGLKVGSSLVVAGFAPHEEAQIRLRQHAARSGGCQPLLPRRRYRPS